MPRPLAKAFAKPDNLRELANFRYATVELGEATIGHCVFQPGWRWSTHVGPLFGRESCAIRHIGYSVSGSSRVEMEDGQSIDIGPDMAFDIPPGHDHWVVGSEPWETVEWGGSGQAAETALEESTSRSLVTVLFTDIVDSTAAVERVGDAAWRLLLADHNASLRVALNVHGGREVNTTGDGLLALFDSPTRAVRCAREMVRVSADTPLRIRVGLHTGEVEHVGDDVRGIAVHMASRLLALAGPDQVVVSSTTRDLLEGSGVQFEDLGARQLKGFAGPRRVYRVVTPT